MGADWGGELPARLFKVVWFLPDVEATHNIGP